MIDVCDPHGIARAGVLDTRTLDVMFPDPRRWAGGMILAPRSNVGPLRPTPTPAPYDWADE